MECCKWCNEGGDFQIRKCNKCSCHMDKVEHFAVGAQAIIVSDLDWEAPQLETTTSGWEENVFKLAKEYAIQYYLVREENGKEEDELKALQDLLFYIKNEHSECMVGITEAANEMFIKGKARGRLDVLASCGCKRCTDVLALENDRR